MKKIFLSALKVYAVIIAVFIVIALGHVMVNLFVEELQWFRR